ncbi:helix-turn-helix transcriptional regulator [Xenorhabdus szentirmaii]|uniref:Transcriptional regulator, arac family n=1 Tax=Xenorhabdus szentirmaii DSM 16338 TaxID=1427518 RepID=W1ISZ1_9GAMM|nr:MULTISPECIES: AraC family transcriptional regulator [Xenorhabdus]MBD2792621.1 helix-turn-helix transcriptional regulator [Xenorhabdus sp. CUL]MBD2821352.1 helix-turn-helix transcriptional regulator [Xenorhabdus sp. 42]PHM32427.1 transcriptional regulator, AraC family [Xenorhabdus szentirmaii DSM 16338]CDL80751.1 Transcriptional regulator, arac family [Xenorhabdus szentirmaii DSM 16338]
METIYSEKLRVFTTDHFNHTNSRMGEDNTNPSIQTEELSDGIHINRSRFELNQDFTEYCEGPPTVSIAFILSGKGKMAIEKGEILDINPGTMLFFYSPKITRGMNLFGCGEWHILDIRFSLNEIKAQELPCFTQLTAGFEKNAGYSDVLMMARPIYPQFMQIVNQIEECQLNGNIRKMYLKAKALEILACMIAQIYECQYNAINGLQRRAVYNAIKIINSDYHYPWTIKSLSKAVGLNERKLKEGFRAVAFHTFHQYLENVRMTAAEKLLKKGMSVIEVAVAVGYSSPSHFSKRFRNHYLVNPKAWQVKYAVNHVMPVELRITKNQKKLLT